MRDIGFPRVKAEDQGADARAIAKLRPVRPLLGAGRVHRVEPAILVVPGEEDHGLRPPAASDDGVKLLHGPVYAVGDIARWVLAEGSVLRLPWAAPAIGSITRVWHTNTRKFVKARLNIAPPILPRRQQQEPIGGEAY